MDRGGLGAADFGGVCSGEACGRTGGSTCRGVGIGQPIDAVFAKIPAQDTELKRWAFQTIYDEGDHSGSLEFIASSFYSLRINTPAYMANITFSRQETAVKFISVTTNFPLA